MRLNVCVSKRFRETERERAEKSSKVGKLKFNMFKRKLQILTIRKNALGSTKLGIHNFKIVVIL